MFDIGFAVEVDPEFPPDGGQTVERMPPGLPRIGAVLRITAAATEPWDIAIGAPNWWRCPNPSAIAFISDGHGYLVDVVERTVLVEIPGVTRIREDERNELVLLTTATTLVAVGPEGVVWTTGPLVFDDLKVVAVDARGVVCTGRVGAELSHQLVVDPLTGRTL